MGGQVALCAVKWPYVENYVGLVMLRNALSEFVERMFGHRVLLYTNTDLYPRGSRHIPWFT